MAYQCVAASVEGFVQQVAVAYLARGYWFYVAGWIPAEKSPETVDAKLIGKYGVDVSRWERGRRKRIGLANMQYIRHGRFFLLMATHGQHVFFEEEEGQIRDARRTPIRFAGYSISYRGGHASVRIDQPVYRRLKECLTNMAPWCAVDTLVDEFSNIPFEPYAPVRNQLFCLLRAVNRVRKTAGLAECPADCIRTKRRVHRPFMAPEKVSVGALQVHQEPPGGVSPRTK